MSKVVFVCINGYEMPYSRVRGYHFAQALRQRGVDAHVLSYRDHLSCGRNSIEMLELGDRQKLWLNAKAFWRLCRQKNAIFYLQKLHYHAAAPLLLSRLGKNRMILDYDDWDIDRSPFFSRAFLNRFFFGAKDPACITERAARSASCCVASSRFLFDYLKGFNDSVFYIPTGVDTVHFKPAADFLENGKTTFVWTGQVWGEVIYRNIQFILECFKEVAAGNALVRLKIVAGGRLMPRVRKEIESFYQGVDIEVVDWARPQDMPRHLSSADVGLLPMLADEPNALWMRSKSPTKLFEYMAMGLPTVSTPMGEACDIIEDETDGFLAADKAQFIEKMKALARDQGLRRKMGEAARKKAVGQYSLDVLSQRLFDVIRFAEAQ